MLPYIDFRVLKERVSLRDALAHYGLLEAMTERPNGSLVGSCPFHNSKTGTSFKVSPSSRGFNCFGCAAKGNVLNFVARMEGCSIHEAAVEVGRWIDLHPPGAAEAYEGSSRGDGYASGGPLLSDEPDRIDDLPTTPVVAFERDAPVAVQLIAIAGRIPTEHVGGDEAGRSIALALHEAYECGLRAGLILVQAAVADFVEGELLDRVEE